MEQSGGQIAAEHAEPLDGGEDRLSALPDELLVLILECLDTTAEAVRTSVLARRWPRLWPRLSKLCFHLRPDSNRIRELLDVPDAPELRYISVTTNGAPADSVTAWLTAAAPRLAGRLVYHNWDYMGNNDEDKAKARRGGHVELPCFEKATTVELDGFFGLVLPSVGVFTQLTDLFLMFVKFHGPCELGNVVSSPRCPCLQKLSIFSVSELRHLSIHSDSLLQLKLRSSVLHLTIVTPILQKLSVQDTFPDRDHPSQPNANIVAPQLVSLVWEGRYDPQYFHLGDLGQLQELKTDYVRAYGDVFSIQDNDSCLRLLQQFQVLYSLHLRLIYDSQEFPCSSDCICDQPKNWRTDELVLDHLEDVHIIGLQGAEHEVAFVQRLLSWATVLKSLRITLDNEVIEKFREALTGFSRLETCIQFDTRDNDTSDSDKDMSDNE